MRTKAAEVAEVVTTSAAGHSDFRPFRERQSIFDVDAEVANRALDLCVPEKDLHGAQVARLFVDYGGLGPSYPCGEGRLVREGWGGEK